ncbi:uncharacterized protein LOC108669958 [Hyalella azteca]|uniref:Uncharacterized protein LOC108669958 n=1 Tax=Hyalella azteca TaxID=294128 RepID=A0A8B7NGZ0_HYAAZ|nr:uncharacterized protein LOC108669958 [Hyalella azteca]
MVARTKKVASMVARTKNSNLKEDPIPDQHLPATLLNDSTIENEAPAMRRAQDGIALHGTKPPFARPCYFSPRDQLCNKVLGETRLPPSALLPGTTCEPLPRSSIKSLKGHLVKLCRCHRAKRFQDRLFDLCHDHPVTFF